MKRLVLNVLAGALIAAAITACGGGSGSSGGSSGGGGKSAKIKMTTEVGGDFYFDIAGSGVATVDWGDGSEQVSLTLGENYVGFRHDYPSATIRTITINGDNITGLTCYNTITSLDVSKNKELTSLIVNQVTITSLDVSKNTALTVLAVYGKLTSLDVSKNTALTHLSVNDQLTAAALNALFGTLHSNTVPSAPKFDIAKIINVQYNLGYNDCDRSIAERKGWTFQ